MGTAELLNTRQGRAGRRLALLLAASATAVGYASMAFAQSAPSGDAAKTGETTVQEIVVTARKREERLINVPISISAVSSETLAQTGADDVEDVGRLVPNVVIPEDGINSRPSLSIRGVFSNVRNMGFEDGVTVYVDGVPLARREGFNLDLGDLAQVEVLRGPQGTLYGKNSIAGALNITTRKPTNELSADFLGRYGNYDYYTLRGTVNVPLVEDKAAIRASVGHVSRDGYITNVFNGDKLNSENNYSGRAQLRLTPNDSFEVIIRGDYLYENHSLIGNETLTGPSAVPGPYTVNYNLEDNLEKRRLGGGALTVNYTSPDDFNWTSISSYRFSKLRLQYDQDLSPQDLFYFDFRDKMDQYSQELRVASPSLSWGDFVAGLYYLHQNIEFDRPFFAGSLLGGGEMIANIGKINADSYAAFAHTNIRITDDLTLFGGLRYTIDKKDNQFTQPASPVGMALFRLPAIPIDVRDRTDEAVNYTVGVRYAIDERSSLYATVASGFKGGGFNDDFIASVEDGFAFDPERVTSYEVGYKAELWNRRLWFSAAAFYMDYSDLQVSRRTTLSNVISNAQARSKGVEVEIGVRPVKGLTLNGGLGYTDAKYTDYIAADFPLVLDYSGNRLTRAPKWTAALSAAYEHVLADGASIGTRIDYNYVAKQFADPANQPFQALPASEMVNGRIGFTSADGRWELALWGKNLTDERAISQAGNFLGADLVSYVPPRTYGIELGLHF